MIRLSLLTEPVTVPSPNYEGVTYTLERLRAQDYDLARQAVGLIVRTVRDGAEVLAPYGLVGRNSVNPLDPAQMSSALLLVAAVEVAIRAVSAWSGVVAADKSVAPVDRAHLSLLLQDRREAEFLEAEIDKAARILAVEKKASGPSPNGSMATRPATAADPATATAAERSTPRVRVAKGGAPASTAARSNMPPRRKRARPSGG